MNKSAYYYYCCCCYHHLLYYYYYYHHHHQLILYSEWPATFGAPLYIVWGWGHRSVCVIRHCCAALITCTITASKDCCSIYKKEFFNTVVRLAVWSFTYLSLNFLMVVTIRIAVFWHVTPHYLTETYWLRGMCYIHLLMIEAAVLGEHQYTLSDYMASHSRRQYSFFLSTGEQCVYYVTWLAFGIRPRRVMKVSWCFGKWCSSHDHGEWIQGLSGRQWVYMGDDGLIGWGVDCTTNQ